MRKLEIYLLGFVDGRWLFLCIYFGCIGRGVCLKILGLVGSCFEVSGSIGMDKYVKRWKV